MSKNKMMKPPKRIEDMTESELAIAAYAYELGLDNMKSVEWYEPAYKHGDEFPKDDNGIPNPYLGEKWV